jgi:hypothetical protein
MAGNMDYRDDEPIIMRILNGFRVQLTLSYFPHKRDSTLDYDNIAAEHCAKWTASDAVADLRYDINIVEGSAEWVSSRVLQFVVPRDDTCNTSEDVRQILRNISLEDGCYESCDNSFWIIE